MLFVSNKTYKEAVDTMNQINEELSQVKKDRFEYMQKNNNLSEFTLALIKQYVPIEKQADLIENIDRVWKIKKEEQVEKQNSDTNQIFNFIFEVTTVCNDSKLNAKAIKEMAIGFGLKVINFNLSQKIVCSEVYTLLCQGTEQTFNEFKKTASRSVHRVR